MGKVRVARQLSGAVILACAQSAYAAQNTEEERGLHFFLGLSEHRDSNVTQAPDGPGKIDSNVLTVRPGFSLLGDDGANTFKLGYTAVGKKYADYSDSDHTDHHLINNNSFVFDLRNSLDLDFEYHKEQGIQDSLNRADPNEKEGNQYHYTDAGFTYHYGAEGAAGQLEVGGNYRWLRYDNNMETSSLNKFKERNIATADVQLFLRMAPKTHLLFEGRLHDHDYEDDGFNLTNREAQIFTGVTWEATGKTQGSIRLGYGKKDFDDSSKDDGDYAAWEVDLVWSPRPYSRFKLATSQLAEDGSSQENYIERANSSITWEHDWSSRFTSTLLARYIQDDFTGGYHDGREDDTWSGQVAFDYEVRRWLKVGMDYQYFDRDSNFAVEKFDREVYGVNVEFRL